MYQTDKQGFWLLVSQAPHRLFFASGCIYLLLPIFWWTHLLTMRNLGIASSLTIIPKEMHLIYMVYGMVTQFILGFILTVFPRWLGTHSIPRAQFVLIFYLMNGGLILMTVGMVSTHWIVALGAFVLSIAYVVTSKILGNILKSVDHPDTYQPRITWVALSSAGIGALAYCLYILFPEFPLLYRVTFGVGVYFFVPVVILSVGYRMVPFFTSGVMPGFQIKRFEKVLTIWFIFSGFKALLHIFNFPEGLVVTDSVLLIATLFQFRTWAFFQKRPAMLLTYLYHSMIWFPLSCLFFIANGIWAIVHEVGNPMLELAGIHALTLGFFSCMIFSMVTRVSRGHSGRPLMTDLYENTIFYLLQLSVLIRIGLELMGLIDVTWIQYTYTSGILWLVVFLLWTFRYLPIYLKPRIDGQPG